MVCVCGPFWVVQFLQKLAWSITNPLCGKSLKTCFNYNNILILSAHRLSSLRSEESIAQNLYLHLFKDSKTHVLCSCRLNSLLNRRKYYTGGYSFYLCAVHWCCEQQMGGNQTAVDMLMRPYARVITALRDSFTSTIRGRPHSADRQVHSFNKKLYFFLSGSPIHWLRTRLRRYLYSISTSAIHENALEINW